FNQERYVIAAMESILRQTYSEFEFLIVDDGSTDETLRIIGECQDPRIKVFPIQHAGFTRALVEGFRRSRGEWIARMDSDDISDPNRLEKLVQFIKSHAECVFVGSAYGFITPNNAFARTPKPFDWRYVEPAHIT